MSASVRLYGVVIAKGFRQFFVYRTNVFSGVLSAALALAARYALWTALFAAGVAGAATLAETMTYFVVNGVTMGLLMVTFADGINGDIQSGDIAQKLVKPFPYHVQLLSGAHTRALIGTATEKLPMLVIALCWIDLLPPASARAAGFFVLTAVLGGVIYALIDLCISYTAFWLVNGWYLTWFRRALFTLFGGLALPLWFYPGWLQTLCGFLPFQYAVFQPAAVYLGRVPLDRAASTLGTQLCWIAVLFALERVVWRRVQHKLIVQGG